MIDHYPQHRIEQEQGFRDATANQLREYRNEQESRYRENQIREGWKKVEPSIGELPMSSRDRLTLTIVGEREQEREKEQRRMMSSSTSCDTASVVDAILIIGGITGFFLMFLKLVN